MNSEKEKLQPSQHQDKQPGLRSEMNPLPNSENEDYRPSAKLQDKVAIIMY